MSRRRGRDRGETTVTITLNDRFGSRPRDGGRRDRDRSRGRRDRGGPGPRGMRKLNTKRSTKLGKIPKSKGKIRKNAPRKKFTEEDLDKDLLAYRRKDPSRADETDKLVEAELNKDLEGYWKDKPEEDVSENKEEETAPEEEKPEET